MCLIKQNKSSVTIFDAQASRRGHTHYLHTTTIKQRQWVQMQTYSSSLGTVTAKRTRVSLWSFSVLQIILFQANYFFPHNFPPQHWSFLVFSWRTCSQCRLGVLSLFQWIPSEAVLSSLKSCEMIDASTLTCEWKWPQKATALCLSLSCKLHQCPLQKLLYLQWCQHPPKCNDAVTLITILFAKSHFLLGIGL